MNEVSGEQIIQDLQLRDSQVTLARVAMVSLLETEAYQNEPIRPKTLLKATVEVSGTRKIDVRGALWSLIESGELVYELTEREWPGRSGPWLYRPRPLDGARITPWPEDMPGSARQNRMANKYERLTRGMWEYTILLDTRARVERHFERIDASLTK